MSRVTSSPAPQLPNRAGTVGMWLLLVSLFMLFASAMLAYLIIRVQHSQPRPGSAAVPLGSLHLPRALWLSTALVLGVSAALGRALYAIRREQRQKFKIFILISLLLAVGFILLQAPSLAQLLREDHTLLSSAGGNHLYALIFVLVLLHALHVIGGIVPLTIVTVKGFGGAYDHEHSLPVQHTAMYWHFLDAVWIVMFSTFQLIG